MKSLNANKKDCALWCGIALMLLVPSVFHSWWLRIDALSYITTGVIVASTLASVIMCMQWRGVRWGLFTFLFVISLFELAHMLVYNGDLSSAGYIRSLFMTTPYEANGAVGRIIRQHATFIILLVLAYTLISIQIFTIKPTINFHKRALLFSGILLILLVFFNSSAISSRPPLNTYVQIVEALHQRNVRNRETSSIDDFYYHASRPQTLAGKEIYVLIIDESLRNDHVSLNGGNNRLTMPRMGTLENLIRYENYYTSGLFTMYAVPMLVTRATPETFLLNYQEYGVQQAFAETGFKTVWLTNEAQLVSDGVSDYVARGAEIIRIRRDMDMPIVVDSLCTVYDKLFIIMNLWGNHQFYLNTDKSTSMYLPDIVTADAINGENLYKNAYDNCILYTDSMLMALTNVLLKNNSVSQWMFTSDHGEGPIGSNGGAHGYTNPSSGEYHVPLIAWYSDEYKTAYPGKVANMIRHKDEPVCADHIFWSVLDMANIRIDNTLQQEGMSIFGDTLLPHKRTLLLPDGKSVMDLD